MQLPIHETFQNTIQGEGYWAGAAVDFIRLWGCPVGCPWCDTGYANGGKDIPRLSKSIDELIGELKSPRVVISGGEPFIHPELPELVSVLESAGKLVHIETSGVAWREVSGKAWITLSPKHHVSPKYPVQEQFWIRANEIKIVISNGSELNHYLPYLPAEPGTNVYLQPEWNDREQTVPMVLKMVSQNPGYRVSIQLHKLLGVQ